MTTIAIVDGEVVCDTQITSDNYPMRAVKLIRLPDGGVAACSGSSSRGYRALQWLADGAWGDPPEIKGATVAIVRPDKSIWLAEGEFPAFPILDKTLTLGCGCDLARMALAQGKSAAEAVAIACELDAASSTPLVRMRVVDVPELPGPEYLEVTFGDKAKIRGGSAKAARRPSKP